MDNFRRDYSLRASQGIRQARGHWRGLAPRTRLIAGALAAIIVIALVWHLLAGFFTKPKTPPPVPVVVALAEQKNVAVLEHTIGTVLAEATVNVTARVEGEIVAVAFKEGQIVHKGDLLFKLDPRPLHAALEQAKAALARDRATLASNANDAARYTALAAEKAISIQVRDQAVAAAKAMAATVLADKAAVDTARLNLIYSEIRSPIDGKTGPILVQIGNLVVAGSTTTLVTVTQIEPVKVSFFLSQDRLTKIQNQMHAGKLRAAISSDGGKSTLSAPVDFIGNAVDEKNGTIELRATFKNADHRLVPGQMTGVDIALEEIPHAVVVPRNAVNLGPDQSYVFIVSQLKVRQVPIAVLYDNGTFAAVKGRIKPGDLVVTDGQLRVVPGKPVKIVKHGLGSANATQSAPGAQ